MLDLFVEDVDCFHLVLCVCFVGLCQLKVFNILFRSFAVHHCLKVVKVETFQEVGYALSAKV